MPVHPQKHRSKKDHKHWYRFHSTGRCWDLDVTEVASSNNYLDTQIAAALVHSCSYPCSSIAFVQALVEPQNGTNRYVLRFVVPDITKINTQDAYRVEAKNQWGQMAAGINLNLQSKFLRIFFGVTLSQQVTSTEGSSASRLVLRAFLCCFPVGTIAV